MTSYGYTLKNLIVNKKIENAVNIANSENAVNIANTEKAVNIANTENTVNIALLFIRITAATDGFGEILHQSSIIIL